MQTKRRVAANLCPSRPTGTVSTQEKASTIHIHYRHLILLFSSKDDTHSTVTRRVEG